MSAQGGWAQGYNIPMEINKGKKAFGNSPGTKDRKSEIGDREAYPKGEGGRGESAPKGYGRDA